MKGKIEIILRDSCNVTVKGEVNGADECDKVLIFDTLADALELTELERQMVGITIFGGGMAALGGPKANTVRISSEMLGVIDRMKNKKEKDGDKPS